MRKITVLIPATALAAVLGIGATLHLGEASDHDDGENNLKARSYNLTDHFAFKSPADSNELALIMYFNPRSLPGKQYNMATNARYEFHVSKVADKLATPTVTDDYVFRFTAEAADATGAQKVKLTVLKDGGEVGSLDGMSTSFGASKAGSIVTNIGKAGTQDVKWFVGMRADSFHFDVNRFFQVRAFLADRFFGGTGGNGNAGASLAPNCRGDAFGGPEGPLGADADAVNLFNPPSCAPDFTKNLNVTAIALNVKIDQLGGGRVFDTWSTISVSE
jgi:Domain of unknown function (DUF4331)